MKTSNDTEQYWSEFEKTGSIASYMNYKSAMDCSSAQVQTVKALSNAEDTGGK
ncbi:MAG: hypothetical protein Q4E94_01900 [Clostridia bacterium]|nr:hypothetical protein [Clostridia bacterium]